MTEQTIDELARRFEEFDPETAKLYIPGQLPQNIALQRALAARDYHEREAARVMREAVDAARAHGMSWHKIGAALGTTGEAARQRYAHK